MNDVQYIVSVDIGKTKIAAGLFNIDLVLEDYIVKPSGKCAQEILALVESIIKYYIERYSNSILGIGPQAYRFFSCYFSSSKCSLAMPTSM